MVRAIIVIIVFFSFKRKTPLVLVQKAQSALSTAYIPGIILQALQDPKAEADNQNFSFYANQSVD